MAEDEAVDRSEWLLNPPAEGEVRLVVELGEGAELSPEATASLEQLMTDLNTAEVEGYMLNTGAFNVGLFGTMRLNSSCNKLSCNKHSCTGTFLCDTYTSNLRRF